MVHQQARRQGGEVAAGARLEGDDLRHLQLDVAEGEGLAHLHAEQRQQPRLRPRLAGRRDAAAVALRAVGCVADAQAAAQRITVGHRLDAGEAHLRAVQHHAGKFQRLAVAQAQLLRLLQPGLADRSRRAQDQIGAEQLRRLAAHGALQAIGEETDGRGGAHGDHQGREQDAQFSGAPVAQQETPGQLESVRHDVNPCAHRPPRGRHPGAGGGRSGRPACRRG